MKSLYATILVLGLVSLCSAQKWIKMRNDASVAEPTDKPTFTLSLFDDKSGYFLLGTTNFETETKLNSCAQTTADCCARDDRVDIIQFLDKWLIQCRAENGCSWTTEYRFTTREEADEQRLVFLNMTAAAKDAPIESNMDVSNIHYWEVRDWISYPGASVGLIEQDRYSKREVVYVGQVANCSDTQSCLALVNVVRAAFQTHDIRYIYPNATAETNVEQQQQQQQQHNSTAGVAYWEAQYQNYVQNSGFYLRLYAANGDVYYQGRCGFPWGDKTCVARVTDYLRTLTETVSTAYKVYMH